MHSGSWFSPWAVGAAQCIIMPALDTNFDFAQLVSDTIIQERQLEDNNAKGDELDTALTPAFSPTSPYSPSEIRNSESPTNSVVADDFSLPLHPLSDSIPVEPHFSHLPSPTSSNSKSKSTAGSAENVRCKHHGHVVRGHHCHCVIMSPPST
jgi:hypothetical protein